MDRLLEGSPTGELNCPVCEHSLNKNDEMLLRNQDHFRCHQCAHDLATVAYRREAYDQQRWLPVLYALGDLKAEEKCRRCSYLGAIAEACNRACSWTPTSQNYSKHSQLLRSLLSQSDWALPEGDCRTSCIGISNTEQQLESDEVIELCPMSLDEALTRIAEGEISDSKTMLALLQYHQVVSGGSL